jgi:8-oxo-dGTP diphosphatase
MTEKETYYYIEKDGRVFLVKKDGVFTFPTSESEIHFPIKIKTEMPFSDFKVFYCEPELKEFPYKWKLKDDVVLMENVDPVVKKSITKSYQRVVANAIILKNGKVLMVKNSRGYMKGTWSIPGGFLTYDESPEEAVKREVKEETGYNIKVKKLFRVYKKTFSGSELYVISFIYLCEISGGKLSFDKTEIENIKFMDLEEAIRKTDGYFSKKALKDYKSEISKN